MRRKIVLLVFVLLVISVGIVVAQSSTSFNVQRFVLTGGGSSESANFSVSSVIGQPDTDIVVSSNYRVSAGFLHPLQQVVWLPMVNK